MAKKWEIKETDWLVLEQETGEIKDVVSEGDIIIHHKEDDGFIHNFNKGEPFVKIYSNAIIVLRQKLTCGEMAFVMSIIPYISYNDNILRLNGEHMCIEDLAKELNMQYDSVRKTIKSLQNKGVLAIANVGTIESAKVKIKSIVANPYIYTRGTQEKREIAGLFDGTGWNKV